MEMTNINGVQVIGVGALLESLFGEDWYMVEYQKTTEAIKNWIKANNAYYYAEIKEKFYPIVGAMEAKKVGKKIMVMENLS